jgi:hypothetical protein
MSRASPRIYADGREIHLRELRPSSHSSRLNAVVDAIVSARSLYHHAVEQAEANIVYTEAGRRDMRQGHALPALRKLPSLYRQARDVAAQERVDAELALDRAYRQVFPDVTQPAAAIFAVEIAKKASDPSLRSAVLNAAMNDDLADPALIELARWWAVAPRPLTGLSMVDVANLKAAMTPEATAEFHRAAEAEGYAAEFVGLTVQAIAQHAGLDMNAVAAVDRTLVEAVAQVAVRPVETQMAEQPAEQSATEQPEAEETEEA